MKMGTGKQGLVPLITKARIIVQLSAKPLNYGYAKWQITMNYKQIRNKNPRII